MSEREKPTENAAENAGGAQAPAKPRRAIPPIPPKPAAPPPTRGGEEATPAEDKPREKRKPEPTRYGDWERNGRCIDF